ncbi:MAG: alpha-ribazole phosphatase family protein [Magnetococcales bacterium]|nr:alpha-ribazole phosphatase family protein [Magnetococcales bacterium]MBF0321422.1 alpha-ribazole phosphatase family protein [Magnetococcales bacterium]
MNSPGDPAATRIDLLRHGEPAGGERYRGSLDDPLSETGWQQMRQAIIGHPPWTRIVTSPLRRCREFAYEIALDLGIDVQVEERFREMSFGLWEGRTSAQIMATEAEHLANFWRDPLNYPPPEGEHLSQFRFRVEDAWNDLVGVTGHRHVLVVAHGGVIRVILGVVLVMPMEHVSRLVVPYACITRIVADRVAGQPLPRLVSHSATF